MILYRKVNGVWTQVGAQDTANDYSGLARKLAVDQGLTVALVLAHNTLGQGSQCYEPGQHEGIQDGYQRINLDVPQYSDGWVTDLKKAITPFFGKGANVHTDEYRYCRMEVQDFWTSFTGTEETR